MCFVSAQLGNTFKEDPFLSKYYTKSVVTAFRCEIFMDFNSKRIWKKKTFTVESCWSIHFISVSLQSLIFKYPYSTSLSLLLTTARAWLPTTGHSLTYQSMNWRTCRSSQRSEWRTLWRKASWRRVPRRAAFASRKSPPRVGTISVGCISIEHSAGSRSRHLRIKHCR